MTTSALHPHGRRISTTTADAPLARADSSLKASLKGKRKYAGWDNRFMATLMAG